MLDRQRATLLVALAHAGADRACCTSFIPKGFFPVQDTGVIQAITEAPQSVSFAAMAERQQATGRRRSCKDPAVESLSSFIGVDGNNTTLNSGRMLINLKPRDDRSNTASDVIRQLAAGRRAHSGRVAVHAAGAGPDDRATRQPHAVPVHAERRRTPDEFATWVPKLVERLQAVAGTGRRRHRPAGRTASQVYVEIDRATASRYGITPATVDNALYDAFGQRIISTIFTQSNQYRVMLEAQPQCPALHRVAERDLSALLHVDGRPGAAVVDREVRSSSRRRC